MTVTELTTISNPEYLFEFINENSDFNTDTQYCILADTSTEIERFNEFTITDGSDVDFPNNGFYTYNVYEQASGSGNLDPTGLTVVEHGRVHVYVNATADNEYTDDTQTTKVYEDE